jgi:hypothetical protein
LKFPASTDTRDGDDGVIEDGDRRTNDRTTKGCRRCRERRR